MFANAATALSVASARAQQGHIVMLKLERAGVGAHFDLLNGS